MKPTAINSMPDIANLLLELLLQLRFNIKSFDKYREHFDVGMLAVEKAKGCKIDEDIKNQWWYDIAQYMFLEMQAQEEKLNMLPERGRELYNLVLLRQAMVVVLT
jgi:hypothetical protein